ncbi:hypothetical protein [Sabulicella glaciei]|nr:hypothetical protein [Roseococcus sp. MDT2-1-1]
MSMMLSSANAWAGAARGIMTAQAKRQLSAATKGSKPVATRKHPKKRG